MKVSFFLAVLLVVISSCSSKIDKETYSTIQNTGNEITMQTQGVLLKNVGLAMQKGGPQNAVQFCNLNAGTIVDSLNQEFNCNISRISEKNRNPNAGLGSDQEKALWQLFETGSIGDTIVEQNNKLVFYKPIKIALPACLKCHGNPGSDIDPATKQKLSELYPKDLATGYALNDFRGLWKVEFERE